jgi:iron(III) transport system ATP-binding protein
MAELSCQDVDKAYGARGVLRDVDLFVPEGTLTAILGASASGKTTLLRVIMGFIEVDAGTVTVGGSLVADAGRVHVPSHKRAIGYVAQEGALFPHLSAGENVAFGLPRSERRRSARVAEVLELVGLGESYVGRRVQELSGGEQRRVALARALAPRPRLVLLDEPFSGLDAGLRVETREAVLSALAQAGTTALLVTHDQAEALSMGREVAVLREGRLVQRAAPATLYREPVDAHVAGFVGEANLLAGTSAGDRVYCALGELPVRIAGLTGPVQVMVRPEQIRMVRPREIRNGASATVTADVLGHTYYGPDTVATLRLEEHPETLLKARTFDADAPAPGELVELHVVGPVIVFPAGDEPPRPGETAAGPRYEISVRRG